MKTTPSRHRLEMLFVIALIAADFFGFLAGTRQATSTSLYTSTGADVSSCRSTKGQSILSSAIDLPQGTLDLLILRTLLPGPNHGWAISERIHQLSREVLQVQQGSLYPALHRLERRGWIKARWGSSENNRRAKFYELTRLGRRQVEQEQDQWKALATAVAQILETA